MAVSKLMLFASGLAVVGLVLHIIGMATPYWATLKLAEVGQRMDVGLFKTCPVGHACTTNRNLSDYDRLVQATAIMALLTALACAAGSAVFSSLVYCGKAPRKLIRVVSGVAGIAAFGLLVLCVIVYAGKIFKDFADSRAYTDQALSISFGLSACAAMLLLLAGIVMMAVDGFEVEQYTY